MRMLCQNPNCDFEYGDMPTAPALRFCPKCGGGHFANLKPIPRPYIPKVSPSLFAEWSFKTPQMVGGFDTPVQHFRVNL
jgi:hypothetical protein